LGLIHQSSSTSIRLHPLPASCEAWCLTVLSLPVPVCICTSTQDSLTSCIPLLHSCPSFWLLQPMLRSCHRYHPNSALRCNALSSSPGKPKTSDVAQATD
jgi:hypothetical protein